jgi:sec-independent protein translocase protein TatA
MGIGGFGMGEMIFIFLIVLLLFGAKRLPEIGSSLGKGIREFKGSIREIEHEIKKPDDAPPRTVQPPAEEDREPRRLGDGNGTGSGTAS